MSTTNQHLLDSSLNSAEMEIIMTEKIPVSKRLSENIAQMEQFFHECDDIKKKEMMLGRQMDVPCYLTFIEVSVDMGTSALGEVLKYLNGL